MSSLYNRIADRYARRGLNVTREAAAQFITGQNSSVASVSAGYATDTYLAGSNVIFDPGSWRAGGVYRCKFDMTKTAAGTAAPTIKVRLGSAATTSDTLIATVAFDVGTAVADTGVFDLTVVFRTVGSGTSAVVQSVAECRHLLAVTGMTTTGASGIGIILNTSSGFNSSAGSNLGISFNGGTSFSGTNTFVRANYSQQ